MLRVAGLIATFATLAGLPDGVGANLPSLPDAEGFAGTFAGVSGGALVVAGGANFPGKKPWEGGTKLWHDTVFVLEEPGGAWKVGGRLPRPLGYGVSITHGRGVVGIGGSDGSRHYADAFRIVWKEGRLATTNLPPLPKPRAYASGALVGDTLYVAGGQEQPDDAATSATVYRIDLAAGTPRWEEVGVAPGGGRMLALAAGFDGAFWLAGGVDLVPGPGGKPVRKYLADAYRFTPGAGWKRIADLPRPLAAAPSPAPADAAGFYLLGGDDGTQVAAAPAAHRGFSRTVLRYDPAGNRWATAGELAAAHVTVPCVAWQGKWVIPGGEVRPGVRSPAVLTFIPKGKE